jgi:hypothetical protein
VRVRPAVLALLPFTAIALWLALGTSAPGPAPVLAAVEIKGSLHALTAAAKPVASAAVPEAVEVSRPAPPEAVDDGLHLDSEEAEAPEPFESPARRSGAIREANLHVTTGHRLMRQRRLGMAEAAYLKALQAFPAYPRAMAGLVRVHLERRDGVEALRWARRLVARQPRRSNNQLLLGDAYALMGARGAARDAWRQSMLYGSAVARKRLAE